MDHHPSSSYNQPPVPVKLELIDDVESETCAQLVVKVETISEHAIETESHDGESETCSEPVVKVETISEDAIKTERHDGESEKCSEPVVKVKTISEDAIKTKRHDGESETCSEPVVKVEIISEDAIKMERSIGSPEDNEDSIVVKCNYCDLEFDDEIQRQLHLEPAVLTESMNKLCLCYFCDKPFSTLCAASFHVAKEHGRKTVYYCEMCQKRFLEYGDFEIHKFITHSKKLGRQVNCAKCSMVATNQTELQIHDRVYHGRIADDFSCPSNNCMKVFKSNSDLVQHARKVHTDFFLCTECGRLLKTPALYFTHMCRHNNITLYDCPNCKDGFQSKDSLRSHYQLNHNGGPKKEHTCMECKQEFKNKKSLQSHVRKSHKREFEIFDCFHCNKRYYSRSYIIKHIHHHCQKPSNTMPSTEKTKNWNCTVCNKQVLTKFNLLVHMRVHTKEGRFFCDICNKYYANPAHKLLMHNRATCDICGKTVRKYFIAEHIAKHSNTRNELCTVCGKSFLQKSTLALHMFSHGAKQFICQLCGKGFNRKDNMKKHSFSCKGEMK